MRTCEDWIESFVDYTDYITSPEIFRRWGAVACIAGALERRVWLYSQGARLHPNLYTILVAPPGVGKSAVTSRVEQLWRAIPEHHVAPSNLTKAALIDELEDSKRILQRPKETPSLVEFNSLKILSNELGVLLPAYEGEFMSTLTDIYDGTPYEERRRSNKNGAIKIEKPQLNLLASTTPAHLTDFLPAGAFDQGFLSRCFLVYSGEIILRPLFDEAPDKSKLWEDLQKGIKHIGRLYGQMLFDEDAAEAISTWHMSGRMPQPSHPKLHNYNTRRTLHLLKLCMVASASDTDSLRITLGHYQTALSWLVEAESYMPDIFKSMNHGGDAKAIEECWYYTYQIYVRKSDPVPEARLYAFLRDRVPAHSIERIIEVMERANLIKPVQVNKVGKCYVPVKQLD